MCGAAGGRALFDEEDCLDFREIMRSQAIFCGVTVLTYAILSNRFHMLVRVPPTGNLTAGDLVERIRAVEGDDGAERAGRLLASPLHRAVARKKLLNRMGDISVFQKELKHRFSNSYNSRRHWFGTVWQSRFRSVVVQPVPEAMGIAAAFIDLLPARDGHDPESYPFSGYFEAVKGSAEARGGLQLALGKHDWTSTLTAYRRILAGKTTAANPPQIICRRRIGSRDIVMGSPRFVKETFAATH